MACNWWMVIKTLKLDNSADCSTISLLIPYRTFTTEYNSSNY